MRRSKEAILKDVIDCLQMLVSMEARYDVKSGWAKFLERHLAKALDIQVRNGTEDEIRDLCGEVRSLYAGKDESFASYQPLTFHPELGKYTVVSGTENFPEYRDKLYECADEIRIIGQY